MEFSNRDYTIKIFPTKTYSFLQRKISTYDPQNVDEILRQSKTSMHSPENMDEILHQRKTSMHSPQNADEILHQRKTSTQRPQNVEKMPYLHKKRQPQRAAFSLYLSGRN